MIKNYDLIIFEPVFARFPIFYPDLGVAMVTAACRANGMKVKVIGPAQTLMGDMLEYDKEEWLSLYNDLEQEDGWGRIFHEQSIKDGPDNFWRVLKELHTKITVQRDLKSHLRGDIFGQYISMINAFFGLMQYHLKKKGNKDILLIRRYMDKIKQYGAVAVGFSVSFQIDPLTCALMRKIKKERQAKIIFGGAFASYLDNKELEILLTDYQADAVVVSEGEEAVPQLLNDWKSGQDKPSAPNTVYLNNQGKLCRNPTSTVLDLDVLPVPEFDLLAGRHYCAAVDILPIQSTRGCRWNKCAFCSNARLRHKHRRFSPQRFVEIIKTLTQKYGVRHFSLTDEEMPPDHALAICRKLEMEPQKVYFEAYGRFDPEFDPMTLQTMYKAGFRGLIWGLESGSQKVLDTMQKGIKVQTGSRILKDSYHNKILNTALVIFGFPGEKKEDIEATFEFFEKNSSYITLVRPAPYLLNWGSFVVKFPEKFGIDPSRLKYEAFNKELFFPDLLSISYDKLKKRLNLQGNKFNLVSCLADCPYSISLIMLINSFDPVAPNEFKDQPDVLLDYYPLAFPSISNKKENSVACYDYSRNSIFNFLPKVQYQKCSPPALFLIRASDGKTSLKKIITRTTKKFNSTPDEMLDQAYQWGLQHQILFFKKSWK
jgi:hypothetical protein